MKGREGRWPWGSKGISKKHFEKSRRSQREISTPWGFPGKKGEFNTAQVNGPCTGKTLALSKLGLSLQCNGENTIVYDAMKCQTAGEKTRQFKKISGGEKG